MDSHTNESAKPVEKAPPPADAAVDLASNTQSSSEPSAAPAADTVTTTADVASPHSADTTSPQQPESTTATATVTAHDHAVETDSVAPTAVPTEDPLTTTTSADPASKPTKTTSNSPPICVITLLLPSGEKHPYKITEKYLAKRNVEVPGTTEAGHKDPFSISVYTLKELILREWREEWETKPSSPSNIRLIYFGHFLEDNSPLSAYKFSIDAPNVIHISVRPQELIDEEDASKGKGLNRDRGDGEATAGCRCVIL